MPPGAHHTINFQPIISTRKTNAIARLTFVITPFSANSVTIINCIKNILLYINFSSIDRQDNFAIDQDLKIGKFFVLPPAAIPMESLVNLLLSK